MPVDLINKETSQSASGIAKEMPQGESPKKDLSELIDTYNDFAKSTSNVVAQAASILEEEIAAGVIAAKRVESHFLDVEKLRSGSPEDVMQRFRRDSHEVVDILIDITNSAIKHISAITQNIITIHTGTGPEKSDRTSLGRMPTITLPEPIKAGESAEVPISLENSGEMPTHEFRLYSTDLVSASGDSISSKMITFEPLTLIIAPYQTEKVILSIKVPEGLPSGTYSGLVMATNLNQLRSAIIVEVA